MTSSGSPRSNSDGILAGSVLCIDTDDSEDRDSNELEVRSEARISASKVESGLREISRSARFTYSKCEG